MVLRRARGDAGPDGHRRRTHGGVRRRRKRRHGAETKEKADGLGAARGRSWGSPGAWRREESTREEPTTVDCGGGNHRRSKGENTTRRRGFDSKGWEHLRGSRNSSPASDGAERRRGDLATSGGLRERAATVASLWREVARLGALSTRVREDYRATARAKGERGQAGRENGGRYYRAETGAVTSGRQRGSELSGLGPGKGRKMGARSPASRVLARTGLPGVRRRTATARAEEGRQWRCGVGV
uniref:Transposon-like n=1 Tax=Oryza rufipogon TaxID=4529 RepID=A0A679BBJ9_ORYRU|nr:transposon-like [Oryza rufipogon]